MLQHRAGTVHITRRSIFNYLSILPTTKKKSQVSNSSVGFKKFVEIYDKKIFFLKLDN